jgi:hypothetical protein
MTVSGPFGRLADHGADLGRRRAGRNSPGVSELRLGRQEPRAEKERAARDDDDSFRVHGVLPSFRDLADADEVRPGLGDHDEPQGPGLAAHVEALAALVRILGNRGAAPAEADVDHDDRDEGDLSRLDRVADDGLDLKAVTQPLDHGLDQLIHGQRGPGRGWGFFLRRRLGERGRKNEQAQGQKRSYLSAQGSTSLMNE